MTQPWHVTPRVAIDLEGNGTQGSQQGSDPRVSNSSRSARANKTSAANVFAEDLVRPDGFRQLGYTGHGITDYGLPESPSSRRGARSADLVCNSRRRDTNPQADVTTRPEL